MLLFLWILPANCLILVSKIVSALWLHKLQGSTNILSHCDGCRKTPKLNTKYKINCLSIFWNASFKAAATDVNISTFLIVTQFSINLNCIFSTPTLFTLSITIYPFEQQQSTILNNNLPINNLNNNLPITFDQNISK